MYIWVILATFLAALYSFNIGYRSDIRAMETEPLAQALIDKLIIQQQSAALYVAANTPPNAKYADGRLAPQIIYSAGIISYNKNGDIEGLNAYLPYAYKYDNKIVSEIYCLKKTNLAQKANQCSDTDAVRFLISYMQIPQRWLNVVTQKPNNDFIAAIKSSAGLDTSIGFVDCATGSGNSCAKYALNGVEGIMHNYTDKNGAAKDIVNMEIPAYMAQNGGFKTTCITSGKKCLAQMFSYGAEVMD